MYDYSQLSNFLLDGDHQKVWDYIKNHGDLSQLEIYQNMITPAMHHIGYLWENNKITVADEHLATATCDFVLSRLAYEPSVKPAKRDTRFKAMFLCLEEEQHYLGLKMANSLFKENDWDTKYFGPNLPLEYALKSAKEWKPHVIGLSVSIVYHLPKLRNYTNEFSKLSNQPVVLLGGRLTENYDLRPYCSPQTIIMKNLPEMKQWLHEYPSEEKLDAIF
ncbi:Methanogenic corrinoid protein MtbC1 [Bacillus sp. cl95]|nr:cobalamin B12-binding domain-containing protein [Bacillus sp. UNCCL13]SFB21880.1 Methanogenic corrinoid protein MtbC1 [Bacillus sp. UNCCL13]SFQ91048.1 Methanogenic corrinoid protein MtbC1 [Bacillus sp. cl95]